MKETNVTIINTNFGTKVLKNYEDYFVINSDFKIEDILNKKKVIFFNTLKNLEGIEIKKIYDLLKQNNIKYINVTNNIEEVLYTDYLIVYNDDQIIIEGKTLEVLKNDKLLKRVGLSLPFMVDLSLLLKDYGLVNDIYINKESLVDKLWN